MANEKPQTPVKPTGFELVFYYTCPQCRSQTPAASPTQPAMLQCESCKNLFPIVPVDEKTVRFLRIMLADGKAAIDPDFL